MERTTAEDDRFDGRLVYHAGPRRGLRFAQRSDPQNR
jgi:hypothetical protein